ncbi:MAG: PilX N-terminal domain-containing pilus assembly protein [Candidatus Polarisedimenticolaceae bacterium]|nr:PilX N-terminal domain-containing pilus assembly protein [Candidatus Polarisedimenticolaceae bacterium]
MNHHSTQQPAPAGQRTQRGAVLVVAMLLLLVMTLLGISGVENSLLEERMSGNFHESYTAMQSAETALRTAENWLTTNVTSGAVQFIPKSDSSYDAQKDWFGTAPIKGLYSTQAAPGISTPCQGKDPVDCSFTATNEGHWCAGSTTCETLPKGYITLGDAGLPAIDEDLVNQQPRLVIEYIGRGLGPSPSIVMGESSTDTRMYAFRITAIGWGRERTTRYALQSHFQLQL